MSDTNSAFTGHLKSLIKAEIRHAGDLLALIDEEKSALASLDDAQISLNAGRKEAMLSLLQAATTDRVNLMADYGFDARDLTLDLLAGTDPELNSLLAELREVANNCVTENRHIGQLINRRSHLVENMLASIAGIGRPGSNIYGPDGQREADSHPRNHIAI